MSSEDDGHETIPRLQPVIQRLRDWQQQLAAETTSDSRAEAVRIGLANRIDTAIRLLTLCDQHDISPGAHWDTVPNIVTPSYMPEVRIIDDSESDDPSAWRELEFREGVAVRLHGGETIVGGHHHPPVTRLQR